MPGIEKVIHVIQEGNCYTYIRYTYIHIYIFFQFGMYILYILGFHSHESIYDIFFLFECLTVTHHCSFKVFVKRGLFKLKSEKKYKRV